MSFELSENIQLKNVWLYYFFNPVAYDVKKNCKGGVISLTSISVYSCLWHRQMDEPVLMRFFYILKPVFLRYFLAIFG